MATPKYYQLTDFSLGQNVEFDERQLAPLTNDSNQLESPFIENYDITEKGALVTATGYEQYVSWGTGVKNHHVGNYEAMPDCRYLVGVSNDEVFYAREYTPLTVHDCDDISSGTYGSFALTGDATGLATDTANFVRGAGSITASIAAGALGGSSSFTVAALTSVNISTSEYVEFFLKLSNINTTGAAYAITSVVVKYGSSATDYYEYTMTQNANSTDFIVGINGLRIPVGSGTTTGTPDLTAMTYLDITINYNTALDNTDIYIDEFTATTATTTPVAVQVSPSYLWTSTFDPTAIVNGTQFKGSNGMNHYILGHSNQNVAKLTSVGPNMLVMEEIATSVFPANSYILTTAVGFLFVANGRTVYYSSPEDETTQAGTIGFNGNVTGLAPTVDKTVLVTLDTVNTEEMRFSFDDATKIYTPVKGEYQGGIGGLSHKSIIRRYNDTIFLGTEGVAYFGETEEVASGNYRVTSLSWKIDPLLRDINVNNSQLAAGYYYRNKKEYGIAIPVGTQSIVNNAMFTWKAQYNSWIYRSGFGAASLTEYRRNDQYELYFGSATSDSVHKFTEVYDYNGDSYVRRYKTKVFNMGLPLFHKRVPYIEIGGAMPKGTEFHVIVRVDGVSKAFTVNDTSLIENSQSSGYVGDDFYGDSFYGGLIASNNPYEFFRFYQRIPLPAEIVEGLEFQFEFYYEGTGRPHKIDLFGMKYTIQPEGKVPNRHMNSTVATNILIP